MSENWLTQAYLDAAEMFKRRAQEKQQPEPKRDKYVPDWATPEATARYSDPDRIFVHRAVVRYAQEVLHHTQRFVFIGQADLVIFGPDPNWMERFQREIAWYEAHYG